MSIGATNGARPASAEPGEPPPPAVADLAQACVSFVERAVKVKLDFEPETLPLLDHYVQRARGLTAAARPEAEPLVAQAIGAYFGEVVRRRHRSWWSLSGEAPSEWEVQLEAVHLTLRPVELAYGALDPKSGARPAEEEAGDEGDEEERAEGEEDPMRVQLLEEDREAVAARLADLPDVSEDEYRSFSTILEIIDIAVDAIRARRAAAGESPPLLRPRDYEPDPS